MSNSIQIPTMTPSVVHEYLEGIGKAWTGKGIGIELGSWLGASSVPLLKGLSAAGYDKQFWAFDRWVANKDQVQRAKAQGVDITVHENLTYLYLKNVSDIYDNVAAITGNLPSKLNVFSGEPIEICIFDAPKTNPVFIESITQLEKFFIPGITILGLLDYYSYRKNEGVKRERLKAPVRYMDENKDRYQKLAEWPDICSCVFFKYLGHAVDSR